MTKRMLVGYIEDGKHSGIDKYLLSLLPLAAECDVTMDFLTNRIDPELQSELNRYGSRLFEIPSLKHPLAQYKAIRSLIRKNGYESAYFNISEPLNCTGIFAAKKEAVSRIMIHSHNSGVDRTSLFSRTARRFLSFLCRPLIARAGTDFFACSSLAGAWMYPKKTMRSDRYAVIPNAVDLKKFAYSETDRKRIRTELGIPEDAFVLGHVGHFCYAKNNEFLLDVLALFVQNRPNAVLLAIGCGEGEAAFREKAEHLGLTSRIYLPGVRQDVPACLSTMDVFLFPSRLEGLPFATVEAQINGLPCVLSHRIAPEAILTSDVNVPRSFDAREWCEAALSFSAPDRFHPAYLPGQPDIFDLSSVNQLRKKLLF